MILFYMITFVFFLAPIGVVGIFLVPPKSPNTKAIMLVIYLLKSVFDAVVILLFVLVWATSHKAKDYAYYMEKLFASVLVLMAICSIAILIKEFFKRKNETFEVESKNNKDVKINSDQYSYFNTGNTSSIIEDSYSDYNSEKINEETDKEINKEIDEKVDEKVDEERENITNNKYSKPKQKPSSYIKILKVIFRIFAMIFILVGVLAMLGVFLEGEEELDPEVIEGAIIMIIVGILGFISLMDKSKLKNFIKNINKSNVEKKHRNHRKSSEVNESAKLNPIENIKNNEKEFESQYIIKNETERLYPSNSKHELDNELRGKIAKYNRTPEEYVILFAEIIMPILFEVWIYYLSIDNGSISVYKNDSNLKAFISTGVQFIIRLVLLYLAFFRGHKICYLLIGFLSISTIILPLVSFALFYYEILWILIIPFIVCVFIEFRVFFKSRAKL